MHSLNYVRAFMLHLKNWPVKNGSSTSSTQNHWLFGLDEGATCLNFWSAFAREGKRRGGNNFYWESLHWRQWRPNPRRSQRQVSQILDARLSGLLPWKQISVEEMPSHTDISNPHGLLSQFREADGKLAYFIQVTALRMPCRWRFAWQIPGCKLNVPLGPEGDMRLHSLLNVVNNHG